MQDGLYDCSRYWAARQGLDWEVMARFLAGHSAERISRDLSALPGQDMTAAAVDRITDKLLPMAHKWRGRTLEPTYMVLLADSREIRLRGRRGIHRIPLLTLTGCHADGRRELLGAWLRDTETRPGWEEAYQDVRGRGVMRVPLICAEEPAMMEPAALPFPLARRTLCGITALQIIKNVLSPPDADALAREIKHCFRSDQPAREWGLLRKRWNCLSRLALLRWDSVLDALMVFNELPRGLGAWLLLGGLSKPCRRDLDRFLDPAAEYRDQSAVDKHIYAAAVYIREQPAPLSCSRLNEIPLEAALAR